MNLRIAFLACALSITSAAHEEIIRLYDGPAPGSEGWTHKEQENRQNLWQTRVVFKVTEPTLTAVLPATSAANGTAVVICPGGGFFALSIDNEGLDVARWLSARGIATFVLKYRLVECKTADPTTEIIATVGVSEALYLTFTALLDPGDEVIIPTPCFVSYQAITGVAGGVGQGLARAGCHLALVDIDAAGPRPGVREAARAGAAGVDRSRALVGMGCRRRSRAPAGWWLSSDLDAVVVIPAAAQPARAGLDHVHSHR